MALRRFRQAAALLLVSTLVVIAVFAGMAFARLHDRPFDFSAAVSARGIDVPDWLSGLKRHERIPFWAHAALATALSVSNANPEAVALQWSKAASYAGRPFEHDVAVRGIRDTLARFESPEAAAAVYCRYVRMTASSTAYNVVRQASIDCSLRG